MEATPIAKAADDYPKFVFIAGTPRSGGYVTLASFDNHPDVLAWPFEFHYFTFYQSIAKGRKKVPTYELNSALDREFQKVFPNISSFYMETCNVDVPVPIANNDLTIGKFDYRIFLQCSYSASANQMNELEYLKYIFDCFKQANAQYKGKAVKYYLILTTVRGIDWTNDELLNSSYFLFSYRNMEESYASLREKYLKSRKHYGLKTFFSIKAKKSSLYWLATYKRISKCLEDHIDDSNFYVVSYQSLQKDTKALLQKICLFLRIEPNPNLYNLTILGIPYAGNANQEELNKGRIANTPSEISVPLCSFERRMFASLGLFDFAENRKCDIIFFDVFDMLRIAFISAFIELPKDKILQKQKPFIVYISLGRLIIFLNLCAIYIIMKSKRLTELIVRKWNPHIENMPFWK